MQNLFGFSSAECFQHSHELRMDGITRGNNIPLVDGFPVIDESVSSGRCRDAAGLGEDNVGGGYVPVTLLGER